MKRSEAETLVNTFVQARDQAHAATLQLMQPGHDAQAASALSVTARRTVEASHVAREALIKALMAAG